MKNKPKIVQACNPPTVELEFGTLHKFDVTMDNGDKGVYQTNKYTDVNADNFPFKVGVECEYEYDLKYPAHPKIKLPKKDFNQSFQFNGKKDMNKDRELMITRQSSLARAVEVLIHNTDKVKADDVIQLADKFTTWVMDIPTPEIKAEPKVEVKVEPKPEPKPEPISETDDLEVRNFKKQPCLF